MKRKRVKQISLPKLPPLRQYQRKAPNIFINYDKNVLDKRMLLDQYLVEGHQSGDDEYNDEDRSDDDHDGLGTDIFRKYIEASGGPLFKAETEMLRRHQDALKLSEQCKSLNEERKNICLKSSLEIGPIKVKRNDFPRHANFDNIPSHPYRTIFTGTTGSGKTTNMINLLIQPQFLKDYFDEIYVFSPNCKTEIEFEQIQINNRGNVFMHEDFRFEQVAEIFSKLKKQAKKYRNDRSQMPRVLLFIDDFAGHKEVMNSELLVRIFFMSRKYSTSTWISSQRYKCVPSNLRVNSEYHVIYEQSSTQTLLIAEELSVGAFKKEHIFRAMDKVSETPYSFLFINGRKRVKEGRFRFTYEEQLIPNADDMTKTTTDMNEDHNNNSSDDDDDEEKKKNPRKIKKKKVKGGIMQREPNKANHFNETAS